MNDNNIFYSFLKCMETYRKITDKITSEEQFRNLPTEVMNELQDAIAEIMAIGKTELFEAVMVLMGTIYEIGSKGKASNSPNNSGQYLM